MSKPIPSILQEIVHTKQQEVENAKKKVSLSNLQAQIKKTRSNPPCRGFADALRRNIDNQQTAVIAEIKKASPSKGIICHNFDPAHIAQAYEQAGATCLSVLTDRDYFQGHNDYLVAAKRATNLPVLRKDFMIDPYQIYESYLLGADCVLLIVACLEDTMLGELHQIAIDLGMDILIEVHTQHELERALQLPYSSQNIYGINNRDLNTFNTDLQTSIVLKDIANQHDIFFSNANQSPLLITESGIHSQDDVQLMRQHAIYGFLIGEMFMKTGDAGQALAELLYGDQS